ncbi:hypothetical protein JCGZ_01894 [Jatropha curcas]|uniref:Calmodulin-binding family protein n=1 Tax=Jatropha curcas TaxID=180498 RepID=A0A067L0W1_JATCU|nr:hypothetical protein JCGZ_01894 [Jatropha curcas]
MGILFSCPFAEYSDLEKAFECVTVKSISFGNDESKTPVRSVSFGSGDLEPMIMKSLGSGKMIVERSVSFKGRELEEGISVKDRSLHKEKDAVVTAVRTSSTEEDNQAHNSDSDAGMVQKFPILDPSNPKHQAAVKLQKVYKSFRTRRKLADCAVLVEQSWWKLLDFAELKHSSISFFDIEKHETAISRWLDIGEGKEVNLEKCPRTKLQQQCIKYLGPMERKAYEVVVEEGKFIYKQTGELLHTTADAKWIFVLSTSKTLYVGKKKKGTFQHSSFLAGGVTTAAGRLIIESGVLKAVWPHSGHYRPTEQNFKDFLSFLRENNVDLTDVKTSPVDEEDGSFDKLRSSRHIRAYSSEEDLIQTVNDLDIEEINTENLTMESIDIMEDEISVALEEQKSGQVHSFSRKLTNLEIPKRDKLFEGVQTANATVVPSVNNAHTDPLVEDGCECVAGEELITEQGDKVLKKKLFEEHEDNEVEKIPEEAILQRINSKKETKSFQLGKQLSCKWTTGAGPRIGCVRDYPSELQFRALEQVNLSPRRIAHARSLGTFNLKVCIPAGFSAEAPATMA